MKLVWIDLETTGLHEYTDYVLEAAVAVADFATPFNIQHIAHAVFRFERGRPVDPFVEEMHEKNGLWAACTRAVMNPAGFGLTVANEIEDGSILAGSSVHFDARFLRVWMPTLAAKFSHRHYDVSAIKLFCESLGMPKISKGEAHRAVADIEESVAHAKMCADWLERHFASKALLRQEAR